MWIIRFICMSHLKCVQNGPVVFFHGAQLSPKPPLDGVTNPSMLLIVQTDLSLFCSCIYTGLPWEKRIISPLSRCTPLTEHETCLHLSSRLKSFPPPHRACMCFFPTGAGSSPDRVLVSSRWVLTSFLFSWMQDNIAKVVCLRGSSAYSKIWVTTGGFAPNTRSAV